MGHWNFNRSYYYAGVDGFSNQDTATAFRHICNDDTTNSQIREWVGLNSRMANREPGLAFNQLMDWLSTEIEWRTWDCWSGSRKRNIAVSWGEIAYVILSNEVAFQPES